MKKIMLMALLGFFGVMLSKGVFDDEDLLQEALERMYRQTTESQCVDVIRKTVKIFKWFIAHDPKEVATLAYDLENIKFSGQMIPYGVKGIQLLLIASSLDTLECNKDTMKTNPEFESLRAELESVCKEVDDFMKIAEKEYNKHKN